MWDPALVINGLVVSTPPQEDAHTVTLHDSCSAHTRCVVHACWYVCSTRPPLHAECVDYQSYVLLLILWMCCGLMIQLPSPAPRDTTCAGMLLVSLVP